MEPQNFGEDSINLSIKFGKQTLQLTLPALTSVKDLKVRLQALTNVLPRGQKLIFKGRVLDDHTALKDANLSNGSKVMLMASYGLHQGSGAANKDASSSGTAKRIEAKYDNESDQRKENPKAKLEHWKSSGVVSLANRSLEVIPPEVLAFAESIRVLDFTGNCFREIPSAIGNMFKLKNLSFARNNLSKVALDWEGLTKLKKLTAFTLNCNQLVTIPRDLGILTSLKQLDLSENKLVSLPDEIGQLSELEMLKVNNNCLQTLPSSIGHCVSLIEINFSSNLLQELPDTMGNLKNLKILQLAHNGLKSFPHSLLKGCSQLFAINLHGNEITIDDLRQVEGWDEFDNRRRAQQNKQIDFGVMSSNSFDEGADTKRWDRW